MPWFKKKLSPVDRRLEELNQRIAELQAEVRRHRDDTVRRPEPAHPEKHNGQDRLSAPNETPATSPTRPRFRTTVTPKNSAPVHGIEPHEVDFFARKDRPVDFSLETDPSPHADAKKEHDAAAATPSAHTGLGAALARLLGRSAPSPPQEKLANYLTAGSFQRIKPLKYEKRVARNRLIAILVIALIIAVLIYGCIF